MVAGGWFSCVFGSAWLFVAFVISAFLGLNESGRWSYRTNLLLCAAVSVAGSICGVFSWFETASVFVLLFSIGGFMLYYRDSVNRMIPRMEELSSALSTGTTFAEMVSIAFEKIREIAAGSFVFIAIADDMGGLFLPECGGKPRADLQRNGGAVWKVFASGRPYVTGRLEPSKDLPFCRDSRSIMSAPLFAHGEKLGVLQIESAETEAFSTEDLSKLSIVAFILSQAIVGFMKECCVPEHGKSPE